MSRPGFGRCPAGCSQGPPMRGRRPSAHPFTVLRLLAVGTQAALAAALTARGVPTSPQAVSRWERGEAIPAEERLVLLSLLLRLRPEDIHVLFWPFLGDSSAGNRTTVSTVAPKAAQGVRLWGRDSITRARLDA